MELKNFFAQDLQGNVIPSPTVYVYLPGTTTLATGLEDKDGNARTNPFDGTSNGLVSVAAPDGDYDMRVTGAGRDTTMRVRFIDVATYSAEVLRDALASYGGSSMVVYDQDDETVEQVLDNAKAMQSYTALRAYTGRATGVRLTKQGIAGFFQRDASDTTSADNGGTIIVDASGRRWKRLYSGSVSVKWFGAVGDWNGTTGTDDTTAVQAALAVARQINGALLFPAGGYLVQSAMHLDGGVKVRGDGLAATAIYRTSLLPTVINGNDVYAVFYVEGGWNHILDLSVSGVAGSTTTVVSGIQFGANIAAKGSIKNVAVNAMFHGITETAGVFLYEFNNVQAVSCGYGFHFASANQKTSLTFNQCYAVNTGAAYWMKLVNYSVMNSCAADNCNWGTIPANPYGVGYGDPTDAKGVYHFDQSDIVLNSIGAEGSYGNGVISMSNSAITINSMFSYDCRSLYVPNYASYPNYAVGPIQCSTAANRLTINNEFNRAWSNTAVSTGYPTKPIASLVAFNYDEASLGVVQGAQVTLANASPLESAKVFAGMGPIGRNCINLSASLKGPVASAVQSGNTILTQYGWVKLAFDTVDFDSDTSFDTTNKRFAPKVAGYYQITGAARYRATTGTPDFKLAVYKNGSVNKEGNSLTVASGDIGSNVSALVYLNGSTDYVELFGYTENASVCITIALNQWTYFQAALVRTA